MKNPFAAVLKLSFYVLTLTQLGSCNGTNVDGVTEQSCASADGLWTVVGAQCNGEDVQNVPTMTFLFDRDAGRSTQTTGRVDCATQLDWLVEVGLDTPLLSLTGSGNLSCTQSGLEASFCSSDVNSCNAGVDITGIKNEFSTCVITNQGMSWIRTVSAVNNPDSLSYCENGQTEVVQLVQGEFTQPEEPPDPEELLAFIEVAGPNPLDFGIHPVDDRIVVTLSLSNIGNGPATGLSAAGLANPFSFPGSNYPGQGGTCGATLEVGEACTITVEFFPLTANYFTDNLLIRYNNGGGSVTISHGLAATASADLAQLIISNGPFYDYGIVDIGNPQSLLFTITNSGAAEATAISESGLSAPFQFTGGVFPGLGGDCTTTLAAEASCQLEVEFNPTEEGPFNDVIEIQFDDGVNMQSVRRNIFGQGVTPAP